MSPRKAHKPANGSKRHHASSTRSAPVSPGTPKRRSNTSKPDGTVSSPLGKLSSGKMKHKSNRVMAAAPSSSGAHNGKRSESQVRSSNDSSTTPIPASALNLRPAVKDLSKFLRKGTIVHPKTRAASSPIAPPTKQSPSLATPEPFRSSQRDKALKVASKTPSRTTSVTRRTKASTAARPGEAATARATTAKEPSSGATPANRRIAHRGGRRDPYEFPSDGEFDDHPAREVKLSKKASILRSYSLSRARTPSEVAADAEIVLLGKIPSSEAAGSRITPNTDLKSRTNQPSRARIPPGSIVVSLDSSYSNKMLAPLSPASNPRLDTASGSPRPRATKTAHRTSDEVVAQSPGSPSCSDEESASEEVSRKLDLPPTSKTMERNRGMERTKHYVLHDSPSRDILSHPADDSLDAASTTSFLAAKGRSSPLSAASQTTSALIAEQLMDTYAPPSNQELAALMSSSPGRYTEYDGIHKRNNGISNGRTEQSLEIPTQIPSNTLRNEDGERSTNKYSLSENAAPQSARVLRSHSNIGLDHQIQGVGRIGTNDERDVLIPPETKDILPKIKDRPADKISHNASKEKAASKVEREALPVKTNIVVELPVLTSEVQTQYNVSPLRNADTQPTAAPKSFQEINGATSRLGEQSQDSDAEALNYVLRRSPQWLKGITGLDPESDAEEESEIASTASKPLPRFPTKTSIAMPLAHTSTAGSHLECQEPLIPANEYNRENPEDPTGPSGNPSSKEDAKQEEQHQGLEAAKDLESSGTNADIQSLSGEGRKRIRESAPADDILADAQLDHKKQKVSHEQAQQQQHDAPRPGKKRYRPAAKKRRLGRRARARHRREQQHA
ncbi:hypothetical protein GGR52DRAFT_315374 [Hypoxylon sp. FL1284]|nr:hypothetical protein GGR52DRAFT_315374 [Hypoxylon sp. FL1284]